MLFICFCLMETVCRLSEPIGGFRAHYSVTFMSCGSLSAAQFD